ncbi:MAG: AmmeMemoRadiSam system protein B [bacterium]|nr:AmmeMemoRadiSam system protein B [bacterium]
MTKHLATMSTLALVLCMGGLPACLDGQSPSPETPARPAAVAGQFYPGEAAVLEAAVRAFLDDAPAPRTQRPLALVSPHAGYVFSGQIAADAYRQAMDHDYDLVVILGTNHTMPGFGGVSVHSGAGYRTPLGLAEIDRRVAAELRAADPAFTFEPGVHTREHSVEVQVPFVQVAFPDTKIVTAVIGAPTPDLCARFGRALAEIVKDRKALIVASSDLSHYPGYDDAVVADRAVLKAVATLDPAAVRAAIKEQMGSRRPNLRTCACGEGPVLTAIAAAKALGATRGHVVGYANSGDTVPGDHSQVVGYGAVVMTAGEGGPDTAGLSRPQVAPATAALGPADKKALLAFARETIHRFLTTRTTPLARGFSPVVWRRQGAFVTLKKDGELRGCIGRGAQNMPLVQVVGAMAFQAAFQDRRFSPLGADELSKVEIEISALTPYQKVSGPEAIVIGRDGVLLRKDGRSAVFLPQVAVEQGWDRDQTLEQLCRKAGLPAGSWRSGAEFHTFQAEIFHESEFQ